jgi:hypothetical protein
MDTATSTAIEFTGNLSAGICYKEAEGIDQHLNQMIDTFCNLLNLEIKELCKERRTDTCSVFEVIGTMSIEYGEVKDAATKRDDMRYRKEFFDLLKKGALCYVDMQRKSLRLTA